MFEKSIQLNNPNQIFWSRHISQIKDEGWTAVWRKARAAIKLTLTLFMAFLTLPIAFIVLILRPILLIRFGPLRTERVGHLALNTEIYLCELDEEIDSSKTFDILYPSSIIANQQLMRMWKRKLNVSFLARFITKLFEILPGGEKHIISVVNISALDKKELIAHRRKPHIYFTPEEEKKGKNNLLEWGLPEGSPFICFQSRDSAYLESTTLPSSYDGSFKYHDYRDSNIHNNIPAVEYLVNEGYYSFRMGYIVKEPLKVNKSRIIDYATNGLRTDFMDIYLAAKCEFFLVDTAGFGGVPIIFKRPVAITNYIPIHSQSWFAGCLFIPKKLWLCNESRFLTFREIISSEPGFLMFGKSEQYEKFGIDVIENTPDEILALVIEMNKRLNGQWETTPEDIELQKRYWSLHKKNEWHANIGAEFLRQNINLLA